MINVFTLLCLAVVVFAQNDTTTVVMESALHDRILTYVGFGLGVVCIVSCGIYRIANRFSKKQTLDLELQIAQKTIV